MSRWLVDVNAAIRPLIREIAEQEERSDGDVVRRLIREGLRQRGILEPRKAGSRSSEAAA
jgi:hypothetical protein